MLHESGRFPPEAVPFYGKELMRPLKENDPITFAHSLRVGFIASQLWRVAEPSLPEEVRQVITDGTMFVAGLLHDNQKPKIRQKIPNHYGDLTPGQERALSRHPFESAAAVAPHDQTVADIIRGHHRFGKNGVTYHDYYSDPEAVEAMRRPHHYAVTWAQAVMALADKADTGVNRINGVHGHALEDERAELSARFRRETSSGLINPDWIDAALQIAWEVGSEDLSQWAFT